MTVVHDAIAAELALLTREVPQPVAPFGYGRDLSCSIELDEYMEEVDENSTQAISQALVRRWTTPRGRLSDDAGYGEDVRSYCNRGLTASEMREMAARLSSEATKDDRVESCEVLVTWTWETRRLAISTRVTPADPNLGLFSFTFAITNGVETLEGLA